jgi:hypothetical protein
MKLSNADENVEQQDLLVVIEMKQPLWKMV